MIKMAAILKFKMEDEGFVGKNGTYIFRIQHTLIDKKVKKIHFGTHIEREPNTGHIRLYYITIQEHGHNGKWSYVIPTF